MKKFFTTLCLAVIGLFTTIPIRAEVGETFYDGFWYMILSEEEKTVTLISGSGEKIQIPEIVSHNDIFYTVEAIGLETYDQRYTAFEANIYLEEVSIPKSVKVIGARAFNQCHNLKSIKMSESIERIGEGSFANCEKIESIDLPTTLKSVGYRAFAQCNNIKDFILPESLIQIEDLAFENCYGIKSISLPNLETMGGGVFSGCPIETLYIDCKEIGEYWFSYIETLTSLTLGNNVQSIGNYAFYGCSIVSLEIPSSVTSIGNSAFSGCLITSLELPSSVTSIGNSAFSRCPITSLELPSSVTSIGNSAFSGCSIVSLEIPSSVVSIDDYAFNSNKITNLSLPNSLQTLGSNVFTGNPIATLNIDTKEIGESWFSNFASLTTLILGNNVQSIGNSAFWGCSISSLEIPSSVTSVGNSAFYGNKITNLSLPSSLQTLGSNVFTGNPIESLNIDCKEIGETWFMNQESLTTLTLGDNVKSIGRGAFYHCSITALEIPGSLTSIGEYAFVNNKIETITLPKSLQTVGDWAFAGCPIQTLNVNTVADISQVFHFDELRKVVFSDDIPTIPAFGGASKLSEITLPSSITSLPSYAFSHCISLSSISLPSGIKTIGDYSFQGCNNLKEISLPYGVKSIGSWCFGECESLEEMTLPETLTYIGAQAFSDSGIKTFVLPSSIIEWGRNGGYTPFSRCPVENLTIDSEVLISLFKGSTTLRNVTIGNSISTIPENSFFECSNLTNLKLGTSVTNIGNNAFFSCALSDIEFNSSLTSIGNGSFSNNPITELTIPKNIKSIGYGAFFSCPIETLYVSSNADLNNVFSYNVLTKAVFNDDATTIPSFRGASKLCDVTLPSPMTALPDDAFVNCVSLKTLNLPGGLQSIGNYAFSGCTGLTVELPSSLQKIGNFSFLDCVSLTELEIPSNVTSIGSGAFSNCSSLQVMRLPENLTSISSNLFANCTGLEKVYFSENVNSFGANAFQNCSSLRSLIIPDGVETIPQGMMQNCTSLTEILIPNSVQTISQSAFQGCTSLKNIDLGTGMYTIGDYAFADCPNITDIHSMALNPPIAESYTFPTKAYTNATVTVREQSLATYNRENPWYRFQNYLTVSGTISLSHYNVDMAGNEVFQLGVYGSDSEIKWSSSNPAVAYANNCGLIVAMGITGSTVITATVNGEEINCNVTVSSPYRDPQTYTKTRAAAGEEENIQPVDIIVEGISGNPPMVHVRLVPVGSRTILDWTSSDPSLATVENGIVTVLDEGDVDLGVETENGLEETKEINTKNIDTTGIKDVFKDTDVMMPMSVYDINGRIIYFNATPEQIKNLDKGLYIIKGKKVMVK